MPTHTVPAAAEGMPKRPSLTRRSLLRATGALAAGAATGAVSATAVALAVPAGAPDPLLALIAEYRTQLAIYNSSGNQTSEEDDALADATMNPPWHRLCDECPTPTTLKGAIEGIRLVSDEMEDGGYGGFELSVLAAVVDYFDGRAA